MHPTHSNAADSGSATGDNKGGSFQATPVSVLRSLSWLLWLCPSQDSWSGPKLVLLLEELIQGVVRLPAFSQIVWCLEISKCIMQKVRHPVFEGDLGMLVSFYIFIIYTFFSSDLQAHHPKRDQRPSLQAPVTQVH